MEETTILKEEYTFHNEIDKLFAEYIKEYSDIRYRYLLQKENSIIFWGLKNNHLWLSEYDSTTKNIKFEWTDTEETDTILHIYKGYGEYKTEELNKIEPIFYKNIYLSPVS